MAGDNQILNDLKEFGKKIQQEQQLRILQTFYQAKMLASRNAW